MSTELLSTLDDAIEAKIVRAFFELLRTDSQIGQNAVDGSGNRVGFPEWRLVEGPEDLGEQEFPPWTAVVYPMMVDPEEMPSRREISLTNVAVSFYVPYETVTESSKLLWVRLHNRLRVIVNQPGVLTDLDAPHDGLADKTERVRPIKPVINQPVRILGFRVTYQSDISSPDGAAI